MMEIVDQDVQQGLPMPATDQKWQPYEEYKDSGIKWLGEIPSHWNVGKIGVECTVKARLGWKGLKASEYVDSGYIFLSTPDIKGKEINFENVNYISAQRYFESPEIMLKIDDVLIAKDGSTLGITNVVRYLPAPATVNSSIAVLRPHRLLNSIFLHWFLSSNSVQGFIQSMKDGMGVPHLFQADLRKFIVLTPPPSEQLSIAAFLDQRTARIDALIAKKEQHIALLQEKRTALISHTVTKGLNADMSMKDSGVEWLGVIPEHWEVRRLKFIASFITSGSRGWAQYYSDAGAFFLRVGNLSRTIIDLDLQDIQYVLPPKGTEGERTKVYSHDVLISITAYIGAIGVIPENIGDAYVSQHIALIRLRQAFVQSRWLGYCLCSKIGQDQFRMLLNGGTKDGLGLDDVANLVVILPTHSEQQAIITYLDQQTHKIDSLISTISNGIKKLQEYRTALISAAVTGKIDVRGAMADVLDAVEGAAD